MLRVKNTIKEFAAPEMFGRGYTEEGEKKAAIYIAKHFDNIGLKTYKQAKNPQGVRHKLSKYFQPFFLDINTFPETPTLQFTFAKSDSIFTNTLQAGKDFIVSPHSVGSQGKELKVWVADTLLFTQNQTVSKNFLALNLQNSLIIYPSKFEKQLYELPKNLLAHWFSARAFIKVSPKLTLSLADKGEMQASFEITEKLWQSFNSYQLHTINFSLTNKEIKNYETQNVIGFIKGTSKSDSLMVFSAHYDHLGSLGKDAIFYGANDNASGISMLLELAQHYKTNPPTYNTVFIAFGAEEAGLLGSKHFVENPLFDLTQIKLLVNLDLVGTGDEGLGVVNATVFPQQYNQFDALNKKYNHFPKIIRRGKAANSDHYFFTEKGVPSFFIYTLGGIQAYHDIDDSAETLPLTKYDKLFQLLVEWIK
jgi:hypothetical protein